VSDYKDKPPPPPDDWTKTTPNINLPGNPASNSGGGYVGSDPDWAKTNYRIDIPQSAPPAPRPPDDFGKTAINIKPIDTNRQDFGKTMYPGAGQSSPPADWGATQANVNIPSGDFGGSSGSDWGSSGPAKTTPYFQLPESERAKYQLPPTASEQAAQQAEEQKAKGGIPGWVWVVAGLMTMFFFAVAVLGVVYFFILRDSSFEVTVKGAPPGSDVKIDEKLLAVSDENGDSKIQNLAPGKKNITITHPSFTCDPISVEGGRGTNPDPVIARCKASQAVQNTGDCTNFEPGEDDRAEACYNAALAALPDPYTAEQLLKALNILIINFETAKFDVPARRYAALQKAASYIKKLPADVIIEIGGHTDNAGVPANNQRLSENRANAVKDFLVKNGVNGSILQTRGYGADRPKRDNSTDNGKYMNRRIEYSIVAKPK
jgi:outer membrane protein OmpA-like peptidoglycan-associated protein